MELLLSEIEKSEAARIERAWRFEQLVNERDRLRNEVKRLDTAAVDLTALRRIHELCGEVPQTILTRGTTTLAWSVPGDMVVRDVVMAIVGGALVGAEQRAQRHAEALATAREKLAETERALAAVEREG